MISAMRPRRAPLVRRLVRGAGSGTASGTASGHGKAAAGAEPPRVFHFKCTQCGKCCTGKGGRVRVNGREREALQRALRVSAEQLSAAYLTREPASEGGAETWLIKQTDDDAQCVFLEGSKCSVYEARPTQCRTFPWWPQNLISDYDWQLAARHCEGITTPDAGTESSSAYELKDVLSETIVYDIHRSGENYTHSELHEMLRDLQDVDPSFMDEYAKELREKFHRRVVHQDDHVTVLDTFLDGAPPTRCFVFNDRLHLVQSEMQLMSDGETLDPRVLVLDVHRAMSEALVWMASRKSSQWKVAVLGSGGGSLVRHIDHVHTRAVASIDAVEPNARVNDVAQQFFGLESVQNMALHEEFGEDFVVKQLEDLRNRGKYDLFFVDVEAGSPGDSILAPPLSMLTKSFLEGVRALLSDVGILAINVITDDDSALRQVASLVAEGIEADEASLFYMKLPKNTVVFLVKEAPSIQVLQDITKADTEADTFQLRLLSELL